jgi:hypothetical protein
VVNLKLKKERYAIEILTRPAYDTSINKYFSYLPYPGARDGDAIIYTTYCLVLKDYTKYSGWFNKDGYSYKVVKYIQ